MRSAALLALASSTGCMAQGVDFVGETETTVMQWLDFGREQAPGVTVGFDLDGAVTTSRDRRGCAQDDFTSPAGEPGIDNNLALLMPLLDLAAENALQALLLNALNEGRLLVFVERTLEADGSYAIRFRRGQGAPLLGTDGRLLAGQTLGLHEDAQLGTASIATREGDVIEARDFDVRLPAVVFATLYVLELKDARLRMELREDGALRGLLGGGIELEQIFEVIRTADTMLNPENSIEALVGDALRDFADLAPRGRGCEQLSAAIEFEAVPAFVFE
jgi:hypothetical protein